MLIKTLYNGFVGSRKSNFLGIDTKILKKAENTNILGLKPKAKSYKHSKASKIFDVLIKITYYFSIISNGV